MLLMMFFLSCMPQLGKDVQPTHTITSYLVLCFVALLVLFLSVSNLFIQRVYLCSQLVREEKSGEIRDIWRKKQEKEYLVKKRYLEREKSHLEREETSEKRKGISEEGRGRPSEDRRNIRWKMRPVCGKGETYGEKRRAIWREEETHQETGGKTFEEKRDI